MAQGGPERAPSPEGTSACCERTGGQQALEEAGFTVHRAFPGGRWFEVTDPDGCVAFVLKQSEGAWHWFDAVGSATASNSSAAGCHRGGLGDALATDSQLRTYRNLLNGALPEAVRKCDSVYRAASAAREGA